jgi:threonine dehydrogenase-like Zn-dependent dehydrogenase
MWAFAMTAPGRLERVEAPEPAVAPGRVLVRLQAGGICGSDLPTFRGRPDPFLVGYGEPGFPLHEVVGEVVAGDLPAGTRVVGWAEGHRGLAEYFLARVDEVVELDGELNAVEATVVQPLCTVLHALDRLPDVRGRHVAVIGQGSIGLLFSHALKARGAFVTGVDRIDRRGLRFGVDDVVWSHAGAWAASLGAERPEIVIEAVGHEAGTLEAAVAAVAPGGIVFGFGVPDDTHYAFPFAQFFRKNATLLAGVTSARRAALAAAREYLREHRALLADYITDVFAVEQAQAAFERAVDPAPGRIKVVMHTR